MTIHKGSIYWVDFSSGNDSEINNQWPGLVIQNNALNNSKLNTVSVLSITPLLKFGELPGNVVLEKAEANLPEKCVVNVTQIKAVEKSRIGEMIGSVNEEKMNKIHDGLKLVMNLP